MRVGTLLRQEMRERLRATLPCKERELRRDLRKAYAARPGRLSRVRAVFRQHGVLSPAMQVEVLGTLPRVVRLRMYCANLGLPEPGGNRQKCGG
jgi:hypothetical protein